MSRPSPAAPLAPASAPVPPQALAGAAWALQPVPGIERRGILRSESAFLLDSLLVRVARGRGAIDVAIAEGLAALAGGDLLLQLGWSGAADYAREVLGVAGRTAQGLARLGRELSRRPLLREAVRRGEVPARRAQAVLPVALGEAEAGWVERARSETVRSLEAAVRELGREPPDGEEEWVRLRLELPEGVAPRLDRALDLAGQLLGAASPVWQRLEAVCQEYLGAFPGPEPDALDPVPDGPLPGPFPGRAPLDAVPCAPVRRWLATARSWLEEETSRWSFLDRAEPVAAPSLASAARDPRALDAELRALAALRGRWDELLGHLAMLVRSMGLWRDMRFATFSHYAEERLGLSGRALEQRVWLERRFYDLPGLRQALRDGRLSYEKARLVASCAGEGSLDAWVARAERLTRVALRREIEAGQAAQMCARSVLSLAVPERVAATLSAALGAAFRAEGSWLRPAERLARVVDHFLATWEGAVPRRRSTPARRALERDAGFCQVPGCSRPAVHAHHVLHRSRGGGDEAANLVALCAAHHLHGIHRGFLRVAGHAPSALTWEVMAARA